MIINAKGFVLNTLTDYLNVWTNKLKNVFGNDFVIKKEGVVDNVATASSLSCMDLENQIAFLIKQMNPRTAEGEWQDQLYSLIGLIRQQATYTVVSRTCQGTPNTSIAKGELIVENTATKDQFRNNEDIDFGEDGIALGSFTAEESGSIDLPNDAIINIITPFSNLTGVYFSEGNSIIKGFDYESDEQFRQRWLVSSSSKNANTEDGLFRALLDLVETTSDLKIFENRENHTQRIVLNTAYDNETIANAIFNSLVDGNMIGLQGDISVDITDSQGTVETIKFDRATQQNIYVKAVVIPDNVALSVITNDIKTNILNSASGTRFSMGSKVYANMLANAVYNVSGVKALTSIKISTDGSNWVDFVELSATQVPQFDLSRITVDEEI